MSRKDQITGKKGKSGNKVSHSHRKSKRRFSINLIRKRVWDEEKGHYITLKVSNKTLRTIKKKGLSSTVRDNK